MHLLPCILLPSILAAQEPAPLRELELDLRTELGSDPASGIRLAPRGCWDGLILSAASRPTLPARQRQAEATVEVWDLALRESPRERTFWFFLGDLRNSLSRALELPPPKHQAIELSEFMATDPGAPQNLDLTKVKSMQDRFNRLPPNGSPVR